MISDKFRLPPPALLNLICRTYETYSITSSYRIIIILFVLSDLDAFGPVDRAMFHCAGGCCQ